MTNPTMTGPATEPTGGMTGTDSATEPTGATGSMSGTTTTPTTGVETATGETGVTTADSETGPDLLPGCDRQPPEAFVGPFDAACVAEPEIGMFNPVVEWHKDTWSVAPSSKSSVTAPVVAQLSDDNADGKIDAGDMPDILIITYNNFDNQTVCVLRAMSGDGSKELLNIQNPQFSRNQNLAVGDIDGDGVVEILTKAKDQKVWAYEHDGTLKWTSAALGTNTGAQDSAIAISDMNGDGTPELITGRAILDNTGKLIAAGTHGTGRPAGVAIANASMSFADDDDGDGQQEVVVGDALYDMAGKDKWFNMKPDGFPAMIDLERDGAPEIAVVYNHMTRVQRGTDGSVVWDVMTPGGLGGPPTVADFDGDGFPEVGVAGKDLYSVIDTDGTVLWSAKTQDGSSGITGSTVYDFEGDGVADAVYADELNLYVYSGLDGTVKLKFAEHNSGTRLEQPVIADIDGDGQVEIAFVSERASGQFGPVDGLTVIGDADNSWRPGRKIWNQHPYHITNVNDDGTIPMVADQNWLSYNNFRSGDLSPPDGLAAPDLQLRSPDTCQNVCSGPDALEIWVQLGNVGATPLTAGAKIDVYGLDMGVESLLKSVVFANVLAPGEFSDAIIIPVDTADLDTLRLVAVANEAECIVDADNEVILTKPFCEAPI